MHTKTKVIYYSLALIFFWMFIFFLEIPSHPSFQPLCPAVRTQLIVFWINKIEFLARLAHDFKLRTCVLWCWFWHMNNVNLQVYKVMQKRSAAAGSFTQSCFLQRGLNPDAVSGRQVSIIRSTRSSNRGMNWKVLYISDLIVVQVSIICSAADRAAFYFQRMCRFYPL